jgi:hypothetical protein
VYEVILHTVELPCGVLEVAGGGGGAERDMEVLNETFMSQNNHPL